MLLREVLTEAKTMKMMMTKTTTSKLCQPCPAFPSHFLPLFFLTLIRNVARMFSRLFYFHHIFIISYLRQSSPAVRLTFFLLSFIVTYRFVSQHKQKENKYKKKEYTSNF